MCCGNNKIGCIGISVILSVILGVLAAFLQISGVITVGVTFIWVALGVALIYLAVVLVAIALNDNSNACESLCGILTEILIGVVGTVFSALVLLAVAFEATSVIGAIIIGVLLLSFGLVVTATACLVRCFANCRCDCSCNCSCSCERSCGE